MLLQVFQFHLCFADRYGHGTVVHYPGSGNFPLPVCHNGFEDLCFSMDQLYKDKHLTMTIHDLGNYYFRGEAQDLEEMLSNLIDNACKWTKNQVWVYAKLDKNNQRIHLFVEDNGPEIPDRQLNNVLQRGRRLDDTVSGHGLGLNIVDDITRLYSGSLTLEKSSHGGLRAILDLPAAACNTE